MTGSRSAWAPAIRPDSGRRSAAEDRLGRPARAPEVGIGRTSQRLRSERVFRLSIASAQGGVYSSRLDQPTFWIPGVVALGAIGVAGLLLAGWIVELRTGVSPEAAEVGRWARPAWALPTLLAGVACAVGMAALLLIEGGPSLMGMGALLLSGLLLLIGGLGVVRPALVERPWLRLVVVLGTLGWLIVGYLGPFLLVQPD